MTSDAALRGRNVDEPIAGAAAGYPRLMTPTLSRRPGTLKASRTAPIRSVGMPKKQAPSPLSTAESRVAMLAIPASTNQYGADQRAGSRSVQPLSGSA